MVTFLEFFNVVISVVDGVAGTGFSQIKNNKYSEKGVG